MNYSNLKKNRKNQISEETINETRRTFFKGTLTTGGALLASSIFGWGLLRPTEAQAATGAPTLAPIPTNSVSLSNYGGSPGASSTTNQAAFANAIEDLKSMGGGTLNIAAGTYNWGSSGSDMSNISGANNIHIYGPGVTIQSNSAGASPVCWGFWNCSNLGITGVTFTDSGANPSAMTGIYAIVWEGDIPTSKFKTTNVTVNSGLMAFRCFGGDLQTEIDMQIAVSNCYYGPNTGTNGNGSSATSRSRFDITGSATRRIFLAFGAKHMDVKVNYTGSSSDIGSNGLIDIVSGSNDPWQGDLNVDDCNFDCTVSGYLGNHQCIFQHYLQGPNNTRWAYSNLKAQVNCVNVTGGTIIQKFVHDDGTAELGTTLRTFKNVQVTGSISGSFNAKLIESTSRSISPGNLILVSSSLTPYQDMTVLPSYFQIFTPSTTSPSSSPAPAPAPTPVPVVGTLVALNLAAVYSYQGFCYVIDQDFGVPGDTAANMGQSTLRLFENGVEIGPAHSWDIDIINMGGGRFDHWQDPTSQSLSFSTSDNTDPRTNGRKYSYLVNAKSPVPAPSPVDTTAPTVTVTGPINGTTVKVGSTIQISASAYDNVRVTRVEFYANGALIGTKTSAPYTASLTVAGRRGVTYRIKAKAFDAAGNSRTSAVVTVTTSRS